MKNVHKLEEKVCDFEFRFQSPAMFEEWSSFHRFICRPINTYYMHNEEAKVKIVVTSEDDDKCVYNLPTFELETNNPVKEVIEAIMQDALSMVYLMFENDLLENVCKEALSYRLSVKYSIDISYKE